MTGTRILLLAGCVLLGGCQALTPEAQFDRQINDAARHMRILYPEAGSVSTDDQSARMRQCAVEINETLDAPVSDQKGFQLVVGCYREKGWIS